MKQETRIQALLDKYLDGATSAAEEQELRRYFASAGEGVPDRWAPFKALFAYVDTERQVEAPLTVPHSRAKARLRLFITSAAAAAVIDGKVYTDRATVTDEALDALQIVSSDCGDSFDALQLMQ